MERTTRRIGRWVAGWTFLALTLAACGGGGGGGGGGDGGGWNGGGGGLGRGGLVAGSGVFEETYYSEDLDFTLSVPEGWTILPNGSFEDPMGLAQGQITVMNRGGGSFASDVDRFQQQVASGAASYQELADGPTTVDGQPAWTIEARVRPPGSTVDMREVTTWIDKSPDVAGVIIKTPEWNWSPSTEAVVDRIMGDITRMDSLEGGMRRALNQAEMGFEAENFEAYVETFSDCYLLEIAEMSRAEILASSAARAQVAQNYAEHRYAFDYYNLRNLVTTGPGKAQCDVTVRLQRFDEASGALEQNIGPITDHLWFVFEAGHWRLAAEKVGNSIAIGCTD